MPRVLTFNLHLDVAREDDGRWIAQVVEVPAVPGEGATEGEARRAAVAAALRLLADDVERGDLPLAFTISVEPPG